MSETESAHVAEELSAGRLRVNFHGADGRRVVAFYMSGNTRDRYQSIHPKLLLDAVSSFAFWQDNIADRSCRAILWHWLPSVGGIALLWFVFLGTDPGVGMVKALRVYMLTLGGMLPFLMFIILVLAAKVGVIVWWIPAWWVNAAVMTSYVMLFLLPLLQLRYAKSSPVSRWRRRVVVAGGMILMLYMLASMPTLFPMYSWI